MMVQKARDELRSYSDRNKIADFSRFFKTGIGQYGYGDLFLGIKVPYTRKVVRKYYASFALEDIREFLYSPYHEERLFALLLLVAQFQSNKATIAQKEKIYKFYINNRTQVNNWDLVDTTAPHIVGVFLLDKPRVVLYDLACSGELWDKRIAIISTFAFIKKGDFVDALAIADILLHDTHDLIHKAVGWVIRSIGEQERSIMLDFLATRYQKMPRTMLRYSIEKLNQELRQKYLTGLVGQ